MGKLITILGGCLVAAGGATYGVYTYTGMGCDGHGPTCSQPAAVSDECCSHDSATCPVGASAGDTECPLAVAAAAPTCCASKGQTVAVSASAEPESCCATAAACSASAGAGTQAVAGAAVFAAKK